MRAWGRLVLGDLVRWGLLLAGMALAGTLIEGGLVAVAVGGVLLAGGPAGSAVGAALCVGLLAMPGAIGAAVLGAYGLDRRFPGRRVRTLRGAASALGLRIAADDARQFLAVGDWEGRGVRLESLAMLLGHRITIAASAEVGGYGTFMGRGAQGVDRDWLQAIQDDPIGVEALQRLVREGAGGTVTLLPRQVHATGHSGWFESPEVLQERMLALLDLGMVAERHRPSNPEGMGSLRMVAAVLPEPGASTPWADVARGIQLVAVWSLGAMSALSLLGATALTFLWPWLVG
jgi:hypothetical protein